MNLEGLQLSWQALAGGLALGLGWLVVRPRNGAERGRGPSRALWSSAGGPGHPRRAGGGGAGGAMTALAQAARALAGGSGAGGQRSGGARWARRRDVAQLLLDPEAAGPPRIILGTLGVTGRGGVSHRPPRRHGLWVAPWPVHAHRRVLAAEAAQSVAVIGPTQSGKTRCLAVPAIGGWPGPVVAASVKADLVRDTVARRREVGHVWCFDPGGHTGLGSCNWSPLAVARSWAGARRMAADLTEVARGDGTSPDGEFWYATAAKLLAPLLFAAAGAGCDMADVVRWVDTQEMGEVAAILEALECPAAEQAARASWQREERQRSSVYTTAETVLEPFADLYPRGRFRMGPEGAPALDPPGAEETADVDVERLLDGAHTLYVCAPAHDQRRLRPLFVALVKQVLEGAFERATRRGRPLDPPLLVVLDEAANIAPLAELDGLAATCAGHGVQLVTIWQDLAQITARYGPRAATVVNNHRAKVFLSGTSDPSTLDHASHLVGDEEIALPSVTLDAAGSRSVTSSSSHRRLLPPDALRQLGPGTGVLVYGSLPPVRLTLRPWRGESA